MPLRDEFEKTRPIIEEFILPAISNALISAKEVYEKPHADKQLFGFSFWKFAYRQVEAMAYDPSIPIEFSPHSRYRFVVNDVTLRIHRARFDSGEPTGGTTVKSIAYQAYGTLPGIDMSPYFRHDTTILGIVIDEKQVLQQVFLGSVVIDDINKRSYKAIERHIVYSTAIAQESTASVLTHDIEDIPSLELRFVPAEKEARTVVQLNKPIRVSKTNVGNTP